MVESKLYRNLFFIALFLLLFSNSFLIYKSNQDIKNIKKEAKVCPAVVLPTPATIPSSAPESLFCGGIAGTQCPDGYTCQLDGDYPDAGGICQELSSSKKYVCPEGEWVDCMPSPGITKSQCQPDYLNWARQNCPGFKGAAL